jgi:hypothetical protein
MSQQILMQVIDNFIDTSIDRFSSESACMVSHFFLDIREIFPDRQRVTQHLIDTCISVMQSRGLNINQTTATTFNVTVNLNTCLFNHQQSMKFSVALNYVRTVHGLNV